MAEVTLKSQAISNLVNNQAFNLMDQEKNTIKDICPKRKKSSGKKGKLGCRTRKQKETK